jgi:hypothetical protein
MHNTCSAFSNCCTIRARCGQEPNFTGFYLCRKESWKKRLYFEDSCGCGFDRTWSENAGFTFFRGPASGQTPIVRLAGMGPKLLISDKSTIDQPVLRWRLRVRGNTAVEFGALPLGVELGHTALHKCVSMLVSVPDLCEEQQAVGFCSQITAGSFLPLKVPVMRGTILDVVLRKGHFSVVLQYPEDAKEISWQNGQPVPRPYYGPPQLRFEQDFSSSYDVRLAATAWAKASFEVLHDGHNLEAWEETDTVTDEIESVTSRIMSERITESENVCSGPELRVTAITNGINHLPIPSQTGDSYPEQCTEGVQGISGMSTSVIGGCPS